jgi:hypothetical protein
MKERGNIQQAIKAVEAKFFPQYASDPKSYEAPAKAIGQVLEKFNQKHNVLAPMLSMLYAFAMEQDAMIKELQKEQAAKTSQAKEKKQAGPSYEELEAGKGAAITDPDEKPFDFREFAKLKG